MNRDPDKILKLKTEPVLLWSNPLRFGDTNGSVFVWTHQGRTELVGTVFSHLSRDDPQQRLIAHSFHSLSLKPLVADRRGSPAWTITVPGINPEKIRGAPAPAKTAALRLTQMRDLAREFSATTMTADRVEQELRLLTQPIYRNEGSSADVLDGALFTFVTGTDPELMLMIEARGTAYDATWYFGAGRFTDLALELRHRSLVLWNYKPGVVESDESPYLSRRTELRNRLLP